MVIEIFGIKRPVRGDVPPFEEGPAVQPPALPCSMDRWWPDPAYRGQDKRACSPSLYREQDPDGVGLDPEQPES